MEGLFESIGFDFHWFKLCLIAVVMLWVSLLCRVYSPLSFFLSFLSKFVLCVSNIDELQSTVTAS